MSINFKSGENKCPPTELSVIKLSYALSNDASFPMLYYDLKTCTEIYTLCKFHGGGVNSSHINFVMEFDVLSS